MYAALPSPLPLPLLPRSGESARVEAEAYLYLRSCEGNILRMPHLMRFFWAFCLIFIELREVRKPKVQVHVCAGPLGCCGEWMNGVLDKVKLDVLWRRAVSSLGLSVLSFNTS